MNNLRSIIIVVLTSLLFLIATTERVSAANDIRFIFNNGFAPSASINCTALEFRLVDDVFATRRALRGNINEYNSTIEKRNLASTSQYCTNICLGMLPKTCRRSDCTNRRELDVDDVSDKGGRSLQDSCASQITMMHDQLDAVRSKVSSSCKSFLERSKRRSDCYPNTVYGSVDGMRVWKITSTGQQVMHQNKMILPNEQFAICNSTKFNIESMNQPCVENATFVLTGPDSYYIDRYEAMAPYALYGNDKTEFIGKSLPTIGLYKVSITPDGILSKRKYFKLMVNHC